MNGIVTTGNLLSSLGGYVSSSETHNIQVFCLSQLTPRSVHLFVTV